MSGVLHPVGPEPTATYWLRRALVLGVLALVAVVVTALVTPESRNQQAVPPAAAAPPPAHATPTASMPAAGSSRSVPATVSASTSPAAHSKTATKSKRSTARARKASAPPSCAAGRLRTTLTGRERLKVQQPTRFDISVINGAATSCVIAVTRKNFEVTIRSGRDRIWSTRDCSRAVGSHRQQRASQEAMTWQLTWNGRRSAPGCKSRPESLRPGTYLATAQLKGADPVRLRMVLHG